jgi:hypothetical protein
MAAMLINAPILKPFRRLSFFFLATLDATFASFCLTRGLFAQSERMRVDPLFGAF